MDLNKENVKKILGIITFTLVLLAMLLNLKAVQTQLMFFWGILFPFVLGGVFAFILNIPMTAIEKQAQRMKIKDKIARPLSMVLSVLFVFAVLAVVLVVVIPQLGRTVDSISEGMTSFLPKVQSWIEDLFGDSKEIVAYIESLEFDWKSWLDQFKDFALSGAGSVISYTMSATMIVINGVVTFFIAFTFSLYLLSQKETLGRQCRRVLGAFLSEKAAEKIFYVCRLSHMTFSKFITGQCLEALILGAMFLVTMTIFRLPYALLVGVLIAFTALIPMVGAFIGCFVGAFLILMVDPLQALIFIILFQVLQQIEGNLIYPHVVGNSVGLPSIWVLFAVTVGGKLMGIAGMLIFIPLMSILYTLFREWVNKRQAIRKKSDKQS
ncbi:MAG: AI-2E family transporter [Lachnospiraceae bacterium]|nr:AI-2E family transporter [Lachnospiraceae bacterium]